MSQREGGLNYNNGNNDSGETSVSTATNTHFHHQHCQQRRRTQFLIDEILANDNNKTQKISSTTFSSSSSSSSSNDRSNKQNNVDNQSSTTSHSALSNVSTDDDCIDRTSLALPPTLHIEEPIEVEQQQTEDHRQRPVESSPASTSCAHRRTTPRTYQRPRKRRSVFSRMQVYRLEFAFNVKQYLSSSERAALARELALTQMQIKVWFQNRRNKLKREALATNSNDHESQSNVEDGTTTTTATTASSSTVVNNLVLMSTLPSQLFAPLFRFP